jgi:hypothetical protein
VNLAQASTGEHRREGTGETPVLRLDRVGAGGAGEMPVLRRGKGGAGERRGDAGATSGERGRRGAQGRCRCCAWIRWVRGGEMFVAKGD